MGHFVKLSILLSLFFFTDHLQTEEIKGIKGKNVTIRFAFEEKLDNGLTFKYANLHKNGFKIEDSNTTAEDKRRSFRLISQEPVLYISNLNATDAGEYYVSLYYKEPARRIIESRRTVLHVSQEEHTTVSPTASNHIGSLPSKTPPHGSLGYVNIITGIVVSIIVLSTALLGWQYLMHNESTGCQLSHQELSPEGCGPQCQVKREGSSSVEYNVLDFHRRPGGKEGDRRISPPPQPQDSVEYSTITFFQGPHGAGGAEPPPRGQ